MLETQLADLGGAPVRYAVAGSGSPVLLVHGLAGSARWWRRNVPAFSEKHTLYLIDLPGFGDMRSQRAAFALDKAPEWLARFLDAVGLNRAAVVGHSMGGAIALGFAAEYRDRVQRLVLAAPAVNLPHKNVLASVRPLVSAAAAVQPQFFPTLVWDALRAGPSMMWRAANELFALRAAEIVAKVDCPALLVWGGRDRLVPVGIGVALVTEMRHASLHVIEHAGHVVMFDRPDEFNRVALRFLAGEDVVRT